jgi:DNA-binding SARP family transcriptional activator
MLMNVLEQPMPSGPSADEARWPVMICLLGNFRLLHTGHSVAIPCGGKIEVLLSRLGLHFDRRVPCTVLLDLLWPTSDSALAHQSLNTGLYPYQAA